jgi:RNA polymerase primary sigma factor
MPVQLERKKTELDLWKTWKKTKNPVHLNALVKSVDPFLQSYVNKFSTSPLPRAAMESQARILAIKAIETYNPNRGAALNTHMGHELRHLNRYVLEYQNIGRIPENRGMAISKFKNIRAHLIDELGREPTVLELADRLQWSVSEVERMQQELRQDLTVAQGKEEAFFDTNFNETDVTQDIVQFVYYQSSPIEQKILEYWFGLGGVPRISLEEMPMKLGMSIDDVRRISKDLAKKVAEAKI